MADSKTADVNGTRLHYLTAGDPDGPPALLWHGYLSTCQAWRKVIPPLAEAGCAVLAPDMRGYGDSDKPAGIDGYDARALAGGLLSRKVKLPVVALGGEKGLGENVPKNVKLVAEHVSGVVIPDCGHFVPEERPDVIVSHVRALWSRIAAEREDVDFLTPDLAFGNPNRSHPMNTHPITRQPVTPIPPDDLQRTSKVARPDTDERLPHIGLVGDTYTVLLSGDDTDGRYCLIDMHVPPGGGPPPHRHDFEESFTVTSGEIEATFRGESSTVRAGETLHIPANAPHSFTNATDAPVRLLCLCAPAGQEEFFERVGVTVAGRTTPPPKPTQAEQAASQRKAEELAPEYRTELLKP